MGTVASRGNVTTKVPSPGVGRVEDVPKRGRMRTEEYDGRHGDPAGFVGSSGVEAAAAGGAGRDKVATGAPGSGVDVAANATPIPCTVPRPTLPRFAPPWAATSSATIADSKFARFSDPAVAAGGANCNPEWL